MQVIGFCSGWIVLGDRSRKIAGPFTSEQAAKQWLKERGIKL